MRDILLADDGDIDFAHAVDADQEVMQSIRIILETSLGSFVGDADMGLDTSDLIGKQYNERYAVAAIREALTQEKRITAVNDVAIAADLTVRTATVSLDLIIDGAGLNTEVILDVG
jgi:phage baseplate assembly protein W